MFQEDDISNNVKHLNADFETRFKNILTLVIPQWIVKQYGDIKRTNITFQDELIGTITNEEVKKRISTSLISKRHT